MLHNPAGLWQQVHFTMTKHAHRASNLANEMSILLEHSTKTWSFLHGSSTITSFKLACDSICSFGETPGQETLF